jgi:Ca2+-binding RTX toxin-like protein
MRARNKKEERENVCKMNLKEKANVATSTQARLAQLPRIATAFAIGAVLLVGSANAAEVEGSNGPDLLFGADDDNLLNVVIQPAGAAVNQSLNDADAMDGRGGNDVMIGLRGSDTMRGGSGSDILIGGTEQGTPPNSDIMYGDEGKDIAIWRAGDGSDAFIGGRGTDALVMGAIDRDGFNIPLIVPARGAFARTGLPTADVTGQAGFCTIEDVRSSDLGYDFLVRFFGKATGALAATVRVAGVEQVFCTSEQEAAITFANLRDATPAFSDITIDEVEDVNATVSAIIR